MFFNGWESPARMLAMVVRSKDIALAEGIAALAMLILPQFVVRTSTL